jgi:hypothetical protein
MDVGAFGDEMINRASRVKGGGVAVGKQVSDARLCRFNVQSLTAMTEATLNDRSCRYFDGFRQPTPPPGGVALNGVE